MLKSPSRINGSPAGASSNTLTKDSKKFGYFSPSGHRYKHQCPSPTQRCKEATLLSSEEHSNAQVPSCRPQLNPKQLGTPYHGQFQSRIRAFFTQKDSFSILHCVEVSPFNWYFSTLCTSSGSFPTREVILMSQQSEIL